MTDNTAAYLRHLLGRKTTVEVYIEESKHFLHLPRKGLFNHLLLSFVPPHAL